MGDPIVLEGGKITEANFLVVMPKVDLTASSTKLEIGIYHDGIQIEKTKTTFIGPNNLDN